MRLRALLAGPFCALVLTGCDGSAVDVELVWAGPPEPSDAGVVSVDGFASFQEGVDEPWERSPAMAAAEFLRLDERTAARTTISARAETGEGTGSQTVVVILDGLPDDSVRAERWRLGFDQRGDTYVLVAALRDQRCQPRRGHRGFSPERCA